MSEVVIAPGTTTDAQDADVTIAPEQTTPKQAYTDWPQPNDQRAQPWNLAAIGISREARDDLHETPGSPNTVSPIVISHSMPILSSGSGGDQATFVKELARRLHVLGYTTDIGTGHNPFGTLSDSVLAAVERFREEYNVSEDPTAFGGDTAAGRARASAHIGPWTWEAIIRASERKLAAEA